VTTAEPLAPSAGQQPARPGPAGTEPAISVQGLRMSYGSYEAGALYALRRFSWFPSHG
jgi:hypothetical protein